MGILRDNLQESSIGYFDYKQHIQGEHASEDWDERRELKWKTGFLY